MEGVVPRIRYRLLSKHDQNEVKDFILKHFAAREPLCAHLNVQQDHFWARYELSVQVGLSHDVCIGAYDCESGEMCGIRINLLGAVEQPPSPNMNEHPLNVRQIDQILGAACGGELPDVLGTRNFLLLFVMAVKQDFGRHGIATELYKRSFEIAKQRSCSCLAVECTNAYTLRATKKLGFVIKNSISYEEYVDPITESKIFSNMTEPHKVCALLVKEIELD